MSQPAPASDRFVVLPLPLLDAPGMALKVYAVLRSYADRDTGEAWPSRKAIAARAGVSIDSVDRAVVWLTAEGWIAVEARYAPEGDRTSNRFHVYGTPRPQVTAESPPPPTAKSGRGVAAGPVEELDPPELDPLNQPPLGGPPHTAAEVALFPPDDVNARARHVMDDYRRWRQEAGHGPTTRRTLQGLTNGVRDALDAGVPVAVVKQGLADWTAHGIKAASLDSFIEERSRGRAPGQRVQPESKVSRGLRVAAMLQAAEVGASARPALAASVMAAPAATSTLPGWTHTLGAMP